LTKPAIWPDDPKPATGPLRGVRVLDLTTVIMGPFGTQMLGDQGADIVKIETAAGDNVRWVGPWHHPGMGPLFLQVNRNKRSVVLDLKSADGKAAMLALAAKADVVVSNVRPAGLARLGLDYANLQVINPRIIYCGAVGSGSGGPSMTT
jgi:crotonobetainyl-CoA:carnitine CoA-transferase CaiB-like acyl-CoA transferase